MGCGAKRALAGKRGREEFGKQKSFYLVVEKVDWID
jgi:hypothetical protein